MPRDNEFQAKRRRVINLYCRVVNDGLEAPGYFYDLSYNDYVMLYNGCGADWMPEKLRKKLTDKDAFF